MKLSSTSDILSTKSVVCWVMHRYSMQFPNVLKMKTLTLDVCNSRSINVCFNNSCLFHCCRFQWHPVLDASIGSNLTAANASRELQLLLERKRLPAWGISSYEFHKKSGKIIFQACNSLYMCLDTGFNVSHRRLVWLALHFLTLSVTVYRARLFSRPSCAHARTKTGRQSIRRFARKIPI